MRDLAKIVLQAETSDFPGDGNEKMRDEIAPLGAPPFPKRNRIWNHKRVTCVYCCQRRGGEARRGSVNGT